MKKKEDKKQKLSHILNNNIYFLKIAFNASAIRVIMDFSVRIIHISLDSFYRLFFIYFIFNAISNGTDFNSIAIFIILMAFAYMLLALIEGFYNNYICPVTDRLLTEEVNLLVFRKAVDVELACFENPNFFNKYTKAASETTERVILVLNNFRNFVSLSISFGIYLFAIVYIDIISIIFAVIPVFMQYFLVKKLNKSKYDLQMANVEAERIKAYVNRAVYLKTYAKELRLSNILNVLLSYFHDSTKALIQNYKKYGVKVAFYRAAQDTAHRIISGFSRYAYAVIRVTVFQNIALPDFMVLINSIFGLGNILNNLTSSITDLGQHSLYINNIKDFLDYVPKISESQKGIRPKRGGNTLTLDKISFRYENSENYVLKNITIKINPKEKIAVVGHNGAGKTTLVKLLMRLYDVTDGCIKLNNENIKEFEVKGYRDLFGTIFQDFQVFSLTVGENILMRETTDNDKDKIENALKASGIYEKINSQEKGIESNLTREFDENGLELSGGEFQKIAIARAFAKDSEFVIMDEPSSALDPIAEYKMYESMVNLCEDKSVIFISHRLSSAVLADKIYLIENGEIAEQGTHKELMEKNGLYADMFIKQAENYI